MHRTVSDRNLRGVALFAFLVLLTGIFLLVTVGHASAGNRGDKLDRQIRTAERSLDEMLLDSSNWLFPGTGDARGTHLEGAGVVFTFSASLTGGTMIRRLNLLGNSISFGGHHPAKVILRKTRRGGDDEDVEVMVKGDSLGEDEDFTVQEKHDAKRLQKKYDRAKDELMDTFMDFGDILLALPRGEVVVLEGRLHDVELPSGREISKITLKAKVDDLRAFSEGSLKENDLRSRISVTEQEE
jgi:hypothetical protein